VQDDFRTIIFPPGAKGRRLHLGKLEVAYPADDEVEVRSAFQRPFRVVFSGGRQKAAPTVTCGGYGPKVADALKGKASVARLTTSKSIGDPALLAEVALVLGQCRFDVVHFNNGLHGWGYSEEEYQGAFPELVATLRKHAPQAKLIWATTTPMRQAGKLDVIAEGTKRVQARNKIAEEIVAREGIAVDDLYGLVKDHPEYWSPDGVHFNAQGVAAQVEQVMQRIVEALK